MPLPATMTTRIYLDHAQALSKALQGAAQTAANRKGCMTAMHGPNSPEAQRAEAIRSVYAGHQAVIDAVVTKAKEELTPSGGGE